jgi:hypothetical protein
VDSREQITPRRGQSLALAPSMSILSTCRAVACLSSTSASATTGTPTASSPACPVARACDQASFIFSERVPDWSAITSGRAVKPETSSAADASRRKFADLGSNETIFVTLRQHYCSDQTVQAQWTNLSRRPSSLIIDRSAARAAGLHR